MIIGTAGHIDHGKTTLVRALTGVDTDRLPEEKRRGITIELGFAPLLLEPLGTVGMVDVPGHESLIRTMLAGATGIDLGLLVVAADEGPMPQTREHLAILSLLGVTHLVVALTKCDLVEADWLDLVTDDVRDFLLGAGFPESPIVHVSAVTGAGLPDLKEALVTSLFRPRASIGEPDLFRMPIDRAFTVRGTGVVVTGTVWSGRVELSTPLRFFPGARSVRARTLHSFGGAVSFADGGQRAAVALVGVHLGDVGRGGWLVGDGSWSETNIMHAEVSLLEGTRALRPREWIRLHLGTSEVGARVVSGLDALQPGAARLARVIMGEPILARAGDRFVLRRGSPAETIGGGVVTDPQPAHRRTRPGFGPNAPIADRLVALLDEAGPRGIAAETLPVRLGPNTGAAVQQAESIGQLVRIGSRFISGSTLGKAAELVAGIVLALVSGSSFEDGVPRARVYAEAGLDAELLDHVVARLVQNKSLRIVSGLLAPEGWEPTISSEMESRRARVLEALESADMEPPTASELGSSLGFDTFSILRQLEKERNAVLIVETRYCARSAVDRALRRMRDEMKAGVEYPPAELREIVGTSRKFLIPFLEYCDRRRFTERRTGGRVLITATESGTTIA